MGSNAEDQYAQIAPPRRGAVWAVATDTTARAYDISKCALGGYTPEGSKAKRNHVVLWLQAETNDVYFYFDSATGNSLDTTTKQSAGAGDLAFADSYCAIVKAGNAPIRVRIDRSTDKFIQVRGSAGGILRMWAGSTGE